MAREPRRHKEASEALFALDQLRHYPQLHPSEDPERNIDVTRAIEDCECIYLFIPALREPFTARAVGSAGLWSLANECMHRTTRGAPDRFALAAVDEFAQFAGGKSMEDMLTLSRKHLLQFILSHQTASQLRLRTADLRSIVIDNTSLRVHFTLPTEEDRDEILDHSKSVTKLRKSTTAKGFSSSITMQETELPGFAANLCRDISGTFGHAVLVRELGDGHHDPVHMICTPPLSKEKYEELARLPLPRRKEPAVGTQSTLKRDYVAPIQAVCDARHAAILALVAEKRRRRNEWRTQIPRRDA